MSDTDYDKPQFPRWFDSESDLPQNLSVDSTIELGVNVSIFSANQTQTRALYFGDSNIASPTSNRGTSVGHVPLEETESCKGVEFLESLLETTPQRKSPPNLSCHRGWTMSRGRG